MPTGKSIQHAWKWVLHGRFMTLLGRRKRFQTPVSSHRAQPRIVQFFSVFGMTCQITWREVPSLFDLQCERFFNHHELARRDQCGLHVRRTSSARVMARGPWLHRKTGVTFAWMLDEAHASRDHRFNPGRHQDLTMSITQHDKQHDHKPTSGNGTRTMVRAHARSTCAAVPFQ